jgi:hypothetical protein
MNVRLQNFLIPPTGVVDGSLPAQNQAAFEESTNFRWWDLKAGTSGLGR